MTGTDPVDLGRFVEAQAPLMPQVEAELRAGAKRSHWMWFVFPQLAGLGRSPTAKHFGLASTDEARAYLAHITLGTRLHHCTRLVNGVTNRTARQIFGTPDDLKFRSSMTLFARGAEGQTPFAEALAKYYNGEPDTLTLQLLDG